MITFVTAFLDLREDRSKDKSVDRCFRLFEALQSTGIRMHVFVSPEFRDRIHLTNGVVETISLEELETYRTAPPGIPAIRTDYHDTRNFLILMNAKSEFVRRAMDVGTTSHYAWIDFSIVHVFRSPDATLQYLSMLGQSRLREGLWFPGCWTAPSTELSRIQWRFCGGFLVGDRDSLMTWIRACESKTPQLSWEVNAWSYWESQGRWKPQWYSANHDDSIIRIPSDAFYTVASLTTIPPRFDTEARLAVESLLPQVDHVYLSIPDTYRRFGDATLPEWTENPKITVVRGPDHGPASKYIGCVSEIPEGSWVFVGDDDQEYAPNLVARMKQSITQRAMYQNHFAEIRGKTSGGMVHGYVGNLSPVDVLQKAREFPIPDCAYFVDDQWMSVFCFRNDIPVLSSGVGPYREIFAVLQGWHEKLGSASLSGMHNRDAKVKELGGFFGIAFHGPDLQNISEENISR